MSEDYQSSSREVQLEGCYKRSSELRERAERVIPGGSQTYSKTLYNIPLYLNYGYGSRVYDVDGNDYIDYMMALGPMILGYPDSYSFPHMEWQYGNIFSTPHELEITLAEKLVEILPAAEMVRFGKNGSDSTSSAIRLARAYTKRNYILTYGYHGFQDWYIWQRGAKGVPHFNRDICDSFDPYDLNNLRNLIVTRNPAAIIMEPTTKENLMNIEYECRHYGIVFILDETISGFRVYLSGCHGLWGIEPDLVCVGKSMANGFPISAVCGKREIMELAVDCFLSSTFGGELISIAAALDTIRRLENEDYNQLWYAGERIADSLGLKQGTYLPGRPVGKFTSEQIIQLLERGILTTGIHNISFAHTPNDIIRTIEVYDELFS